MVRLTSSRSIDEVYKRQLGVDFDRERVNPGKESYGFLMAEVREKFVEHLILLNAIVRGGLLDHYEWGFDTTKEMLCDPNSFVNADVNVDFNQFYERYFQIYLRDNEKKVFKKLLLLLDEGAVIYYSFPLNTSSAGIAGGIAGFSINGRPHPVDERVKEFLSQYFI